MSDSKMRLLSELKKHYAFYNFIPFEDFEMLKEDQLEEIMGLSLNYALDEKTASESVYHFLKEQKKILNNRDIKKLMSKYLPEDYIPYISELSIGFLNTHEGNVAACFNIQEPKTYYQIEDSIYKELMMLPKEFLSDKSGLNIKVFIEKYKTPLAVFTLDFEKSNISCNIDYKNLLYELRFGKEFTRKEIERVAQIIIKDEYDDREQLDRLLDIKKDWIKSKDYKKMIQELDHYLFQLQDRDTIAIRHHILDADELKNLISAFTNEGIAKIKYMLLDFETYMDPDFVYRSDDDKVKTLEYRDMINVFEQLEQIERFYEGISYNDILKYHMDEVSEEENKKLIEVCQRNDCLKYGESLLSDVKLPDLKTKYYIYQCEKRLDAMIYLQVHQPFRHGVVFEDMAFIKMSNIGDCYLYLKKDQGQWFMQESVDMKQIMKGGNFYGEFENMRNRSVTTILDKKQKKELKSKRYQNERNR